MKILVVQDFLRSGGTERQSVLLARGFAEAGHETRLLTFRPGGALDLAPAACPTGLERFSLQKRDTRLDWWAPGLTRHARAWSPAVVLCMGRMANSYAGALQDALPGAAVICTLRTGKPLPRPFRRALPRVQHVVANSHEARTVALTRYALPADHVSVIHNALVFPIAAASPAALDRRAAVRLQHGATPETVVLLDVAMFRPEKNQIALVEVVAGLTHVARPVQLWLVGDGPARAACRRRALALGVTDRVRFLGWTADPAPFYGAADLAVHASRRESLSNFLIEAQAHGLPAVACDALGVAETFRPGETGFLIPPDDADAFRAALRTLIDDPARRADFGTAARRFARENFSTATQIGAYLALFQRLTHAPSAPA